MELRMPTWEQVETVYHGDLTPSFPASELKPLRAIGEMWRDAQAGCCWIICASAPGGATAAPAR